MSGKPFRWGIYGCGRISSDFCTSVKTLLPAEDHEIFYAASKDIGRAESFAKKIGIERFTDSYETLAKCSDVDAIYIGTLNPSHKPLSILAMNHGKHVLCEKPVAMNSKELNEMLECAKKNNVFFMEAMWSRFTPGWKQLYSIFRSKKYGEPIFMQFAFGMNVFDKYERFYNATSGGSMLTDLGVYPLNFADIVFEDFELETLHGLGNIDQSACTDRSVSINMKYSGNRVVQMFISGEHVVPFEFSVYFEKCKMVINRPVYPSGWTVHWHESGEIEQHSVECPTLENLEFKDATGLIYEAEHVRQRVLSGNIESDIMTYTRSEQMMNYMVQIRKQIGVTFPQDEE